MGCSDGSRESSIGCRDDKLGDRPDELQVLGDVGSPEEYELGAHAGAGTYAAAESGASAPEKTLNAPAAPSRAPMLALDA